MSGQRLWPLIGVLAPVVMFFGLIVVMIARRNKVAAMMGKARQQKPWPAWSGLAGMSIFILVWVALSSRGPGSVLKTLADMVPMTTLYVPMCMVPLAFRRIKTGPQCAKCHYDVANLIGPDGPPGPRCPECGHPLTGLFGTKTERVVVSKPWVVAMLAACIPFVFTFGAAISGNSLTLRTKVLKVWPTNSLIAQVGSGQGFTYLEWVELRTRTLSGPQREDLASRLLLRKALALHAWSDEAKWLIAEFRAGRLSPEAGRGMMKRFTSMRAPNPGEPPEVRLASDQAWGLDAAFNGWSIFAVRNGVRDAAGATVAAPSEVESALSIKELASAVPKDNYDVRTSITGLAALGEVRPGDRTHVWVIAEPRARGAGAVVWKDGSPVTAPDAIVVEFQIGVP